MLFPQSLLPQASIQWKSIRNVRRAGPFGGQRSRVSPQNRFEILAVDLVFLDEDWTVFKAIYDFWNQVEGAVGTFNLEDIYADDAGDGSGILWTDLFAGTTDGVEDTYDLPIKTSTGTGFVFKHSGATKTVQRITSPGTENGTSDIYLYPAAGTDGKDQAKYRVLPASGGVIKVSGKGHRIEEMAFLNEEFPFSMEPLTIRQTGTLNLIGVR
jgi:hypothetical protein